MCAGESGETMTLPISNAESFLECRNVTKSFTVRHGLWQRIQGYIHAVEDVSLSIHQGETFGLVGESGCGKSTLSKIIVGLLPPSQGTLFFRGQPIIQTKNKHAFCGTFQMVFQDPFSSLNPRLSIGTSIAEPLLISGVPKKERIQKVLEMLDYVGLQQEQAVRYPHEFSGGQRQRVAIARALITHPELLVCDEAVSALDASVQAQVLNLLKDLQDHFGLTYFFISHDLAVVGYMSDRIAVMYLGRIMELAPTEVLFNNPGHPYTQLLLESIPVPDPLYYKKPFVFKGERPNLFSPPSGCPFHPQCPEAMPECCITLPTLTRLNPSNESTQEHFVRCYLYR